MKISQRTATLNDAAVILSWRNAPQVRAFSQHSDPIPFEEHLKWLSARLKKVRLEPIFLFTVDNDPVGMSRLDLLTEFSEKCEVSILVDPGYYARGIGGRILNMTCESFFHLHPNKSLIAKVNKENFISQKLFVSKGFKLLPTSGDYLTFEKSRNLNF
jgi:RimJ/RimL family protein N-acetyltransferase